MRIHDPLKQWKLSPMDLQSRVRWEAYTQAKEAMLQRTNLPEAPWWVVEAVDKANDAQKVILVPRIERTLGGLKGKTIAIWGLAFKPKTDDMREAPALAIIDDLLSKGAAVRVYDPKAGHEAKRILGERVTWCARSYDAVDGADALVVVTEWNEFREPDFPRIKSLLRRPAIFDGRNIYDPAEMKRLGFEYQGIGRR